MSEPRDNSVSLIEIPRAVLRHKKKALFAFLSMTLVVAAVVLVMPSEYVSEAKLFVRVGREAVSLDPTATTGDRIYVNKPHSSEVLAIIDVLESHRIARRVVDVVGPKLILEGATADEPSGDEPLVASLFIGSVQPWVDRATQGLTKIQETLSDWAPTSTLAIDGDYKRAVAQVMSATESSARPNSSVIYVSCRAKDPELAQRILQTITAELPKEYLRLNRTEGSFQFFEDQTRELRERLGKAEHDLIEHRSAFGLITIGVLIAGVIVTLLVVGGSSLLATS